MKMWLIRHGMTRLGEEKRYQGRLDDGLSPVGRTALVQADFRPKRVYLSPARRARETADSALSAKELGAKFKVGNILSSDVFYSDNPHVDRWRKMGVLAVEMEASALYMNAARAGKRALAICTISDHVLTGAEMSAEERQTTFTNMMKIALEAIISEA